MRGIRQACDRTFFLVRTLALCQYVTHRNIQVSEKETRDISDTRVRFSPAQAKERTFARSPDRLSWEHEQTYVKCEATLKNAHNQPCGNSKWPNKLFVAKKNKRKNSCFVVQRRWTWSDTHELMRFTREMRKWGQVMEPLFAQILQKGQEVENPSVLKWNMDGDSSFACEQHLPKFGSHRELLSGTNFSAAASFRHPECAVSMQWPRVTEFQEDSQLRTQGPK